VIVGIETDGVAGQHHHFARANVHAAARGNAVAAHAVHVELHAAGLVEEDAVQPITHDRLSLGIQPNDVARDDAGAGHEEVDAVLGVAGDHVAGAGGATADKRAELRGAIVAGNENAAFLVPQPRFAVRSEADVVALDLGADALDMGLDLNAGALVGRDDVAGASVRCADERTAPPDMDAMTLVARGGNAVAADPDVVPLEQGIGEQLHAVRAVAGDHVAVGNGNAANRRVAGAGPNLHTGVLVAQWIAAVGLHADQVAL